jgi:hypothetical protein
MRKLRVKRKGFMKDVKRGPGVKMKRIKPITYLIKDIGKAGRGKKVIPALKADRMNRIAKKMGYYSATTVPDAKISVFARNLIKTYGERRAFGMVHAQVIYRKRIQRAKKEKFLKIRDAVAVQMKYGEKTPGWK